MPAFILKKEFDAKDNSFIGDQRPYVAEFIGTFFFLFVGAGSIIVSAYYGSSLLWPIAVAHGGAIFLMVAMFGAVSGGHFNPAVTFAMVLKKEIGIARGLMYIGVQLAGAVTAVKVLSFIPRLLEEKVTEVEAVSFGVPALGSGVPWELGVIIEIVLTAILVTVILRTAVEQKLSLAPIAIGGAVCFDVLMGGPLTGAAMNPARWFGPAAVSGSWDNGWVYWAAPLIGGAIAFVLNEAVSRKLSFRKIAVSQDEAAGAAKAEGVQHLGD